MTDASEVKISDVEITAFYEHFQDRNGSRVEAVAVRDALAAFLARRVPDAEVEPSPYAWDYDQINMAVAHNACRAHILMGDTQ